MSLLALILFIPALGAIILSLQPRLTDRTAAIIGVGSIGLSALLTFFVVIGFLTGAGQPSVKMLWHWVAAGDFSAQFSLYLDGLSVPMLSVISGVWFLIHLFASWYMAEELEGGRGFTRFFAYMNLFVCSMLLLVLGNNLFLLYMGWEGVGLCSYLLIGYHYKDHAN